MANYVNNVELYEALVEYNNKKKENELLGKPKPKVSNKIGKDIASIAEGIAQKHRFAKYRFRDDMIMDGIINCLTYIDNFDPDKYNNPFSYFYQIITFAYYRFIDKERRYLYTKFKLSDHMQTFDMISDSQNHDDSTYSSDLGETESSKINKNEFMRNYEEQQRIKTEKRKAKLLEDKYNNETEE